MPLLRLLLHLAAAVVAALAGHHLRAPELAEGATPALGLLAYAVALLALGLAVAASSEARAYVVRTMTEEVRTGPPR